MFNRNIEKPLQECCQMHILCWKDFIQLPSIVCKMLFVKKKQAAISIALKSTTKS